MKRINLSTFLTFAALLLACPVLAQEQEPAAFDPILEMVVGIIAVIGFFVLAGAVRQFGGAVGKSFLYVRVGLLCLAAAFFVSSITEFLSIDENFFSEVSFEFFSVVGIVLIALGPKFSFPPDPLASISTKKKKK